MPHIIVKLWPGRSDRQKAALTGDIVEAVMRNLEFGEESVSVAFEEIASGAWIEQVYVPDIRNRWDKLTKKPGYGPRR
jgi:4-oxalocrotonate tautomerase